MKLKISTETLDKKLRLEHLNLNEEALKDAVNQGYLARTKLTANHPRIFFGYSTWAETVARLREVLLPLGWIKLDKANYELVINEPLEIAIAVATGNELTGSSHGTPSNKCPKGANTMEAIQVNNQMDLFPETLSALPANQDNFTTWILLYYIAENEIRYELSLPYYINNKGQITAWQERIILTPLPLGETRIEVNPIESQDIDIPIKRKAS